MTRWAQRITLILAFPLIFALFCIAMLIVRSYQWLDKVRGDVFYICGLFRSAWQTT